LVFGDEYPKVEQQVENLQKTIQTLQTRTDEGAAVVVPSRFSVGEFDPFNPTNPDEGVTQPGMQPGAPPGMKGPRLYTPGMPAKPGASAATRPEGVQEVEFPEYCLVRVMDVSIQPGKIYQYRLRVRMTNPLWGRKDVAFPEDAKLPELRPNEDLWYVVPDAVKVPAELRYYEVDQQELDGGRRTRGPAIRLDKNQTVFQIHRWLDTIKVNQADLLVGLWAIAERIPVYRGENVDGAYRIEVPYWKPTAQAFVIANDGKNVRQPGVEVWFGPDRADVPPTLLVDFEGGTQIYNRVTGNPNDEKPTTQRVEDQSSINALVLSPQGKLLYHERAVDAKDPERVQRLEEVRQRLDQVRSGGGLGGSGSPGLFPGGGQPGGKAGGTGGGGGGLFP